MFHWQDVLGWRFRIEDLMRQLFSFPNIKEVKVYYGLNLKDKANSEAFHKRIRKTGAILRSKPVKFIKKTIDETLLLKRRTRTLFNDGINDKITQLINEIRQSGILIEEPKALSILSLFTCYGKASLPREQV